MRSGIGRAGEVASMDAATIKALYARGIAGFDMTVAPLATDRATGGKAQHGLAAAKIDHAVRSSAGSR